MSFARSRGWLSNPLRTAECPLLARIRAGGKPMSHLTGKREAIIAPDGFEQIEMTSPRQALDEHGAKTVLVSPKDGKVQGFKHHDKADSFNVDLPLAQANAADFDAVVLPGGVINGDAL